MAKYDPLRDFLTAGHGQTLELSFRQVEQLVGPLPDTARERPQWWANEAGDTTHVQCLAWRDAGYSAFPDLNARSVRFEKR